MVALSSLLTRTRIKTKVRAIHLNLGISLRADGPFLRRSVVAIVAVDESKKKT